MPFARSVFLLIVFLFTGKAIATEFKVEGQSFYLDGKPFQIRSGEIHYPRVPKENWRDRIRMAKAMGLNTISTYLFWNYHEITRGIYDFEGEKDLREFLEICRSEGMYALVRPGPYICAEWEFGGQPGWLLADKAIQLRTSDPKYLVPACAWMEKAANLIQPLSISVGGPVLMVQIENEYASYGNDTVYLEALRGALKKGGYTGTLYTCDESAMLRKDGLTDVLRTINLGGMASTSATRLETVFPDQPVFIAEYWTGWFDQWQKAPAVIRTSQKLAGIEWLMTNGASFNLYMFHGGTNRGTWNGANRKEKYLATTSSYDYSAPLDESGRPTPAYFAYRDVIQTALKTERLPDVPTIPPTGTIGSISLSKQAKFADCLPKGTVYDELKTMEDLGQTQGMIIYRTTIKGPVTADFDLGEVKDRAYILLDGDLKGTSGRSSSIPTVSLAVPEGTHYLDFIVENMGRVNYGTAMMEERKGLEKPVQSGTLAFKKLETVTFPLDQPPAGKFHSIDPESSAVPPMMYSGNLKTDSQTDTFLDMRGFGRGFVWFNGRNLGRYWNAGPSQSIFLPGCWIRTNAENEIVVLELEKANPPKEIKTTPQGITGN